VLNKLTEKKGQMDFICLSLGVSTMPKQEALQPKKKIKKRKKTGLRG
jgi:hypothetical protein